MKRSSSGDARTRAAALLVLATGLILGYFSLDQGFANYFSPFKVTKVCLQSYDYPTQYWDLSFAMKNAGSEPITSISVTFGGNALSGGLWQEDQYGYQTWNAWSGILSPGQGVFGEWRTSALGMALPGDYTPGEKIPLTVTATSEDGGASTYNGFGTATDEPLSCPVYEPS